MYSLYNHTLLSSLTRVILKGDVGHLPGQKADVTLFLNK
jgi:hypothetical protein